MRKTYAHHTPTPKALDRIRKLREEFSRLTDVLEENCPAPSREKSVALTHLETAAMWAIKALVCNDPESKVEA